MELLIAAVALVWTIGVAIYTSKVSIRDKKNITRSHPKPTETQLNKYGGPTGETKRWNPKPTSKQSRPSKEEGDSVLKNSSNSKDELLHDLIHYIKSREVISRAYADNEAITYSVEYELDNEELKSYVDLYFDKQR